jgi:hypothetical protein
VKISIDFDDTITRDPAFFLEVAKLALSAGHQPMVVTMRYPWDTDERLGDFSNIGIPIYYTSHKAKKEYMFKQGINIDVWMDDNPAFILMDAKLQTQPEDSNE